MTEVKLMLVVSLTYLLVEVFGPLLEILDIISDGVVLLEELLIAFGLDVLLVAVDDGVVKVVLRAGVLVQQILILVTDELIVFWFDFVLVLRVQVFNGHQLLQTVDLSELIHELKPSLVSHYSNITIKLDVMSSTEW
jgi:hypothetical protein